jgi:chromosomal replication initiation ATPase DnaA
MGDSVFNSWFEDFKFVSIEDDKMTVGTGSKFKADYIQNNFGFDIEKMAKEELDCKVSIIPCDMMRCDVI